MSERLCSVCRDQRPAFICFCDEVIVCKTCISKHLLDDPKADHKPKPIGLFEVDEQLISAKKCKPDYNASSEDASVQSRRAQKAVLERDLENLHLFQNQSLLNLQQVRHRWAFEVERVIDESAQALSQRAQVLSDAIKQKIADLDDPVSPPVDLSLCGRDSLLNLQLQFKDIDLVEFLRKSLDIRLDFAKERADSCFLYKFFGGSNLIGVFDPRTESMTKHVSAGLQFYHNSCWSVSPDGNVLVTGGSLTGRSRSDCILFTPLTNSTQEVQPMQIARRSHTSVYLDNVCYVFGGLVDQERTSLCERYFEARDKWEDIGHMKERRAYLGCCKHRGRVYISGGSVNSTCEIFTSETLAFELVTISQLTIEDFCSLLPVEDEILLFHGNFRGEVSKWNLATNQFSTIAEMCYGNSWSSCAPLLSEGNVYMLRSDSVFRYHLETGANAYVLRMTKATKKRIPADG